MNDAVLSVRPFPINAVRWSAVLAGLSVGIAVQIVFNLSGFALGIAVNERGGAYVLRFAADAWNTLSMLAGALVGGYVAARASGLRRIADGMLHGTVAWGATTLVFAVLALTTAGALAGLFNAIAEIGRLGTAAAAEAAGAIPTPGPATAGKAARAAATAGGWLALAIVLSLIAALAGGALGARGARRFTHGTLRPGLTPNVTVTKDSGIAPR